MMKSHITIKKVASTTSNKSQASNGTSSSVEDVVANIVGKTVNIEIGDLPKGTWMSTMRFYNTIKMRQDDYTELQNAISNLKSGKAINRDQALLLRVLFHEAMHVSTPQAAPIPATWTMTERKKHAKFLRDVASGICNEITTELTARMLYSELFVKNGFNLSQLPTGVLKEVTSLNGMIAHNKSKFHSYQDPISRLKKVTDMFGLSAKSVQQYISENYLSYSESDKYKLIISALNNAGLSSMTKSNGKKYSDNDLYRVLRYIREPSTKDNIVQFKYDWLS